jgi:uncharacterized protein (TIGR02597 family)
MITQTPRAIISALTCAVVLNGGLLAETAELNGVSRLTLNPGANFISAPLQRKPAFVGKVSAVTASSITFAGFPNWSANQFGPVTVGATSIPQFAVIVRSDAAATPGIQGDWWLATSNTAGTVTVQASGTDLATLVAVGSELEVRPLTSIKDLFGADNSAGIIADTNFDFLSTEEDVIRVVSGTSFTDEFVYHSDANPADTGWYFNGEFAGNGSTLRIAPSRPLMYFRRAGSTPLTLGVAGAVQTRRLTTYLQAGANAVGTVFPVNAPITTCNLFESGWNADLNFDVLTAEEDIGRVVNGTSFGQDIFYYSGPDEANGWYVGGNLTTTFSFEPQRGYMLFRKTGAPVLAWRQSVPFTY